MLGLALLVLAPRWRGTRALVLSGVWPAGLAVVYAALIATHYLTSIDDVTEATFDRPGEYVLKGRARMRWGEQLEFVAEAGPGDFIYVPPYVPHQEINASPDEALECVLMRSDGEAVAVNLDIEPVEKPEAVRWIDPTHPH